MQKPNKALDQTCRLDDVNGLSVHSLMRQLYSVLLTRVLGGTDEVRHGTTTYSAFTEGGLVQIKIEGQHFNRPGSELDP